MSSWNVQDGISENGLAALARAHKKALSLEADEETRNVGEENSSFAMDTVSEIDVFDDSKNDLRKVSFES